SATATPCWRLAAAARRRPGGQRGSVEARGGCDWLARRVERWRQAAAGGGRRAACARCLRRIELEEGAYRGAEQASCGSRLLTDFLVAENQQRKQPGTPQILTILHHHGQINVSTGSSL
uniref:Uncharacterized protein n=1 Tax=Oryza meridionalis TaxID=40149 RepID=A0A0E0CJG4_9ORYZ